MQRIRLLYCITKLELGGAQKQLLSLLGRLSKDKFEIFVFTADEGYLLNDALSLPGVKVKSSNFLKRPINPFKDILALIEIYRFIKQNKIDIMHTHSSKAGILGRIAAKLAKTKYIFHTVHGWSFNDFQPFLLRKCYIGLERICAKLSDKIIVVSIHDKEKGLKNRIGEESKYALIRYGVDFEEFKKPAENSKEGLGIGPQEMVVTNISCFKPQKSCLDFIELAHSVSRRFSNVKFLLVGDGVLRKKIERLIHKLGMQKQVILTGWRRDISAILSATDVLALTSLWEGLSIAVLEAMSAGKPVVATDTGGVKEVIVEAENGFVVKLRDTRQMAQRIIQLLKDDGLRKNMGERSQNLLGTGFRVESLIRSHQDLYEGVFRKEDGSYVH